MPRSPSYSPPRRGDSPPRRGESPPRRGRSPIERPLKRDERSSLLVRNIPRDMRPDDVRALFLPFGPIKDVYLPRDFHTKEPRGFGFIQFLESEDARAAKQELDRSFFGGREITVVFAEENRKRPQEMRERERPFSRGGRFGGGGFRDRRSPPPYSRRSRSFSRSPPRRRYSPSPPPQRRVYRDRSLTPPPLRNREPVYRGDYGPPGRGGRGSPPYHPETRRTPPRGPPPRDLNQYAGSPPRQGIPRSHSPPY